MRSKWGLEGVEGGRNWPKLTPQPQNRPPPKVPKWPFLTLFRRFWKVLNSGETSICEVFCRERPHNYIRSCSLPPTWAAASQRGSWRGGGQNGLPKPPHSQFHKGVKFWDVKCHFDPQNDRFSTTFRVKNDPVFEASGKDSFADK